MTRRRGRPEVPSEERCRALVFHRDTYRYCGGKRHFAMHYRKDRCARRAVGSGLCRQHADIRARGMTVTEYPWL